MKRLWNALSRGERLAIMAGLVVVIGLEFDKPTRPPAPADAPAPTTEGAQHDTAYPMQEADRSIASDPRPVVPTQAPPPTQPWLSDPLLPPMRDDPALPREQRASANFATFGPGTAIIGGIEQPTDEQAEAWRDQFRRGSYFGAFATADDGSAGWSWGYANVETAETAALAYCQVQRRTCKVVAWLVPDGAAPAEYRSRSEVPTLSWGQAEALYRVEGARGSFRAFAYSKDGAWGAGAGEDQTQAEASALATCARYLQKRENQPDMPCRVGASYIP